MNLFGVQYDDNDPRDQVIRRVFAEQAFQERYEGYLNDRLRINFLKREIVKALFAAGLAVGSTSYARQFVSERIKQASSVPNLRTPSKGPTNKRPLELTPLEKKRELDRAKMTKRRFEIPGDEEEAEAGIDSRMEAVGSTNGHQETRITPAKPRYGIAETLTIGARYDWFFSIVAPDKQSAIPVKLNMNLLNGVIGSAWSNISTTSAPTKGLYADHVPGGSNGAAAFYSATSKNVAGGINQVPFFAGSSLPAGYEEGKKMYSHFSVISVDWKLTMANTYTANTLEPANQVMVFWGYECVGAVSGHDMVYPNDMTLIDAIRHPELKAKLCKNQCIMHDGFTTIEDTWYPNKVRRDVQNDEDVKTWTKVSTNPSMVETLKLMFYKPPFGFGGSYPPFLNCWFEAYFNIQFKGLDDRIQHARIALPGSSIPINYPEDNLIQKGATTTITYT